MNNGKEYTQKDFENAIDAGDVEHALEIVYSEDSNINEEEAFCYAVKKDCLEYVEKAVDDIDINNDEGYCHYLYYAVSPEMEEFLFDNGALRSWEDYDDENYLIAVETVNNTILTFNDDFRREIFSKLLEKLDQTEEEFIQSLENNEELDCEDICAFDYEELCDTLFISVKNGKINFEECWDEDAGDLQTLLEDYLGYVFEFEGDSWKFQSTGVYFISKK